MASEHASCTIRNLSTAVLAISISTKREAVFYVFSKISVMQ